MLLLLLLALLLPLLLLLHLRGTGNNRDYIGAKGGLASVINAINNHPDTLNIQYFAVYCLYNAVQGHGERCVCVSLCLCNTQEQHTPHTHTAHT